MVELYAALEQVNQFYRESNGIYHEISVALKMTDTTFYIFYALSETNRPLDQRQLCADWNLPKQTVNSAITALIRQGLIYLEPSKGRSKYIRLTDAGDAVVREKIDPIRQMECRALQQMEPEERRRFLELMARYTHLLHTQADETIAALKAEGAVNL